MMPLEPVQIAFDRSGLSLGEVCRRLGWRRRDGSADTQRLQRRMGRQPFSRNGEQVYQTRISRRVGLHIIWACGMHAKDFGL